MAVRINFSDERQNADIDFERGSTKRAKLGMECGSTLWWQGDSRFIARKEGWDKFLQKTAEFP